MMRRVYTRATKINPVSTVTVVLKAAMPMNREETPDAQTTAAAITEMVETKRVGAHTFQCILPKETARPMRM
jgi:hypothetical protein